MKWLLGSLVAALAVVVLSSELAGAAFTSHQSNPQDLRASASFPGPEPSAKLVARSKTNDGGASSSSFNFGLALTNTGTEVAALSTVTMRYWFTSDYAPELIPACYYAVFGCGNIAVRVVEVDPVRTKADHYVEVDFTGGSLAAGATASLDQLAVRTNSGTFTQTNDHSFLSQEAFTQNDKVTVYVGGKLVFGTEPEVAPVTTSVEVFYANHEPGNPNDGSIGPELKVNNTGSSSIDLRNLTLRYWFTRDSDGQLATACNYAQMGCGPVTRRLVTVAPPRREADMYLEVGFTGGSLEVGGTTGPMQLQVIRTDGAVFDETNDYSWGNHSNLMSWDRVTAYLNGSLIWGTEP
jgi:hypothetical protein